MKKLIAVVLAAGEGTRMRSSLAKVLHPLAGAPMLSYVLDTLQGLKPEKILVITGYQEQQVRASIAQYPVEFANQAKQLGTGHALRQVQPILKNFNGTVLVVNGDTPLLTPNTLKQLVKAHLAGDNAASLLTTKVSDASGYGRILRDEQGRVFGVIEEKDASAKQRKIKEIATGVYCFTAPWIFTQLKKLKADNAQGEYYLTDVIKMCSLQNLPLGSKIAEDAGETMGINDRSQQAQAEGIVRARINQRWLRNGVRMLNPAATYIDKQVSLGKETVLYPQIVIEGRTKIGQGCIIGPNCHITDSVLANGVNIRASCVITESIVKTGAAVGPFAHLRPGTVLEKQAKVGNFVEVKKSYIGEGSKASHLTYLGDTTIGKGVNIGAGTITCNYDGKQKHPTIIEDGVFVGSGTQLVAPVRVGKDALIGAGSTITKNVPPRALALSRKPQENKENWIRCKKKD